MAKVSIIIPVYNVGDYVEQCVRSAMEQTIRDIEIITVDDGSPDGAGAVCDQLAKEDHRVKSIHQKNQGVSVARNTGIESATGKWICFVDGDDYLHPQAVEKLLAVAEKSDCDICIGDYYVDREGQEPRYSQFVLNKDNDCFEHDELIENCMLGNLAEDNVTCIGVPWAKLYRRQFLLEKNLRYLAGMRRNQDVHFNLYAFHATNRIVYCREAVYYYRVWDGSAVNRYSPRYDKTAEQILVNFKKFFDEIGADDQLRSYYEHRAKFMYYECLKLQVFHPDRKGTMKDSYQDYRKLVENPVVSLSARPANLLSKAQKIQLWLCSHGMSVVSYAIMYLKNR